MWPWTTKPVMMVTIVRNCWINTLSIDVWFVMIWQYLVEIQLFEIWNLRVQEKNRNIDKIAFKVIQMKFLAMHIAN